MSDVKTVWVVDDDVSIGWVLEKALSKHAYKVMVFRGVKPLLQALKTDLPDVVISDIQMPGVDGLKLLDLLQENFPSIPVIIMTAFSDFETTINSYKKGAFDYLAKPFDINKVLNLVQRALQQTSLKPGTLAPDGAGTNQTYTRLAWQQEFEQRVKALLSKGKQDIYRDLSREIDEILIHAALQHTDGHKQKAAKALGWGRNTLTRKMQNLAS